MQCFWMCVWWTYCCNICLARTPLPLTVHELDPAHTSGMWRVRWVQSPPTFSRNRHTSLCIHTQTHQSTRHQRVYSQSKACKAALKLESFETKELQFISPPLLFLAAASMLGSPTSLGSFLMSSRQMKENTTHVSPDADRMALQL